MFRKTFILLCTLTTMQFTAQIENYSTQNKTPTYQEVITFYTNITKKSPRFKWITGKTTDVGKPLNLFVISKNKNFDIEKLKKEGKAILMINNGIHPGEPDGVDACIQLVKEFANDLNKIPDSVVICIVPIYNIDGALQRNNVMRMNQNGPEEFGFRGNAQNLDLNRDFIKCDASNTKALITFFHQWQPQVLVDTHVSNGADYQYTMTLIATQHSKLNPVLSNFLYSKMVPQIYADMKTKGWDVCPYVESFYNTPDSGIVEFMETPRFFTGYASLFNCIGFVTETHMLKPYPQRVKATLAILKTFIQQTANNRKTLIENKLKAEQTEIKKENYLFNWKLNEKKVDSFLFLGYEAKYKPSTISGLTRLYYDREKPWAKKIVHYTNYFASDSIKKPEYYVLPQCWTKVVELLKLNGVQMTALKKDTSILCDVYVINDFKTGPRPYEAHYVHSNIKTVSIQQKILFFKGDYLIATNQKTNRYIVETLEPRSEDSFFAWGFFDAILNQKEWFSDYVFEEVAEQIIKDEPKIKQELDSEKLSDKNLAADHFAQLNFIFQRSKYKEKSHNRYPVARILK